MCTAEAPAPALPARRNQGSWRRHTLVQIVFPKQARVGPCEGNNIVDSTLAGVAPTNDAGPPRMTKASRSLSASARSAEDRAKKRKSRDAST